MRKFEVLTINSKTYKVFYSKNFGFLATEVIA